MPSGALGRRGSRPYLVWVGLSDSDDIRGVAGIARIEDAAKFVVAAKECVRLINEEGWAHFFDHAEEGRRADVGSRNRTVCEPAEDAEQRGLATTFFRRLDAKISAHVAQFECVGVKDPKGESLGGKAGEDHEAGQQRLEFIKQRSAINI